MSRPSRIHRIAKWGVLRMRHLRLSIVTSWVGMGLVVLFVLAVLVIGIATARVTGNTIIDVGMVAFFVFAAGLIVLWVASIVGSRSSNKRQDMDGAGGEFIGILLGVTVGSAGFAFSPMEPAYVVIGLLLLLLVLYSQVAWRLAAARERREVGCCPSCGYNLTGNVSGRCPECGKEVEPTSDA